MGAMKAGVTIVTFDEKENIDALGHALKDSGARGFMFSPQTQIEEGADKITNRENYLKKLMPELNRLYPGDPLKIQAYPDLKQIIQLGYSSIRGVIKFKDAMVYANPKLSNFQIPDNETGDQAFVSYKGGKEVSSFTNGELASHAQRLWEQNFSSTNKQVPVFMSVNLETPLAFSAFLANNAHHQKVFIPSTFNMSKILNSFKT